VQSARIAEQEAAAAEKRAAAAASEAPEPTTKSALAPVSTRPRSMARVATDTTFATGALRQAGEQRIAHGDRSRLVVVAPSTVEPPDAARCSAAEANMSFVAHHMVASCNPVGATGAKECRSLLLREFHAHPI